MTRRPATPIALFAALAVLAALPAAASARRGDRNHDRIPDRWERANHLSLRTAQARRDPDRDGLSNLREYRAHTNPRRADTDRDGLADGAELRTGNDPRDPDSDGDGVRDGAENAGAVVSFDGTTLTIALAAGGTLAGTVDGDTDLQCDAGAAARAHTADAGDSGDDPGADDPAADDPGASDPADDPGDDGMGSGDGAADDPGCAADALRPGAIVHEAEVELTPDGVLFDSVELR
jgi:hypothetical protein